MPRWRIASEERCGKHPAILEGNRLAAEAGGLPELSGLEKPCSDEKNDATDGRELVQGARGRDWRGRATFRIAGGRVAEERKQRQASNRANHPDVRDQFHAHGAEKVIAPTRAASVYRGIEYARNLRHAG